MKNRAIRSMLHNTSIEEIPSEVKASESKGIPLKWYKFLQFTKEQNTVSRNHKSCNTSRTNLFAQKPIFHYTKRATGQCMVTARPKLNIRNTSIISTDSVERSKMAIRSPSTLKILNGIFPHSKNIDKSTSHRHLSKLEIRGNYDLHATAGRQKKKRLTLGNLIKKDTGNELVDPLSRYVSPGVSQQLSARWESPDNNFQRFNRWDSSTPRNARAMTLIGINKK